MVIILKYEDIPSSTSLHTSLDSLKLPEAPHCKNRIPVAWFKRKDSERFSVSLRWQHYIY